MMDVDEGSVKRRVIVDERKWPNTSHWHFDATWLGMDEFGTWMFVSKDTIIQRGDEPERLSGVDFVGLIPPDEWWIVEFYRNHPAHSVYVNIGTVPNWDGNRVTQIDLDLDVIRKPDGTAEIIDQDEFADHQVALAYPQDIIRSAKRAAAHAANLLRARTEPFGDASLQWWETADAMGLTGR